MSFYFSDNLTVQSKHLFRNLWYSANSKQYTSINICLAHAPSDGNIQVFDFFAQSIAVKTQQMRRPDLVTLGRRKAKRNKGAFYFA